MKLTASGSIALALALAGASTALLAASATDTISARQSNFKLIGKSFKAINDELRKDGSDMKLVSDNAGKLAGAAKKISGHFPAGSGPEAGVKTHALPDIWAKPDEFKAATTRLVDASAKLASAARSGDVDTTRLAARSVGGACKGCHDPFKARD